MPRSAPAPAVRLFAVAIAPDRPVRAPGRRQGRPGAGRAAPPPSSTRSASTPTPTTATPSTPASSGRSRSGCANSAIHHIRENLVPNRPDQYQALNQLAAAGIKSTLILGAPEDGSAGLAKLTSILASSLRGSVDAVEGPNEYDLHGGSGWMSKLAPYQAELYSAIKSQPGDQLTAGRRPLARQHQQRRQRRLRLARLRQHPLLPQRRSARGQRAADALDGRRHVRLQAGDGDRDRLPHRGQLERRPQSGLRGRPGHLHAAPLPRLLQPRRRPHLLLRAASTSSPTPATTNRSRTSACCATTSPPSRPSRRCAT